jgi:AraC family transcriptional regulator
MRMSFARYRAPELWRSFMPFRREIANAAGNDLWSVAIFGPGFYRAFNPEAEFERWACMEVAGFEGIPASMEPLGIPGGLYAVFLHRGTSADAPRTFGYIFGEWLPGSGFDLDDRPHFEILAEKYNKDDPSSGEEVWIPVKPKIM